MAPPTLISELRYEQWPQTSAMTITSLKYGTAIFTMRCAASAPHCAHGTANCTTSRSTSSAAMAVLSALSDGTWRSTDTRLPAGRLNSSPGAVYDVMPTRSLGVTP